MSATSLRATDAPLYVLAHAANVTGPGAAHLLKGKRLIQISRWIAVFIPAPKVLEKVEKVHWVHRASFMKAT